MRQPLLTKRQPQCHRMPPHRPCVPPPSPPIERLNPSRGLPHAIPRGEPAPLLSRKTAMAERREFPLHPPWYEWTHSPTLLIASQPPPRIPHEHTHTCAMHVEVLSHSHIMRDVSCRRFRLLPFQLLTPPLQLPPPLLPPPLHLPPLLPSRLRCPRISRRHTSATPVRYPLGRRPNRPNRHTPTALSNMFLRPARRRPQCALNRAITIHPPWSSAYSSTELMIELVKVSSSGADAGAIKMSLPPSPFARRSGFGLFSNPFVPVLCGARVVAGAGASSF